MNIYFLIAGILCFLLGLIHSILGEVLIFKTKRDNGSIVPAKNSPDLKERHLRIIWATWHLATIFGFCIGGVLVKLAITQHELITEFIIQSAIYAMFVGAVLVFSGTRGRHPGWIILLLIGILLIIGL